MRVKDTHRLKVSKWKKLFHANRNHKRVEIVKFIPDKIKNKVYKEDKEWHHITIKCKKREYYTS